MITLSEYIQAKKRIKTAKNQFIYNMFLDTIKKYKSEMCSPRIYLH